MRRLHGRGGRRRGSGVPHVRGQAEGAMSRRSRAPEGRPASELQQAFRPHHALQCGFCTPGFLMTTLHAAEQPTGRRRTVRELLSGNLCRCTGYRQIVEAVLEAWGRPDGSPATEPRERRPDVGGQRVRRLSGRPPRRRTSARRAGAFVADLRFPGWSRRRSCAARWPTRGSPGSTSKRPAPIRVSLDMVTAADLQGRRRGTRTFPG